MYYFHNNFLKYSVRYVYGLFNYKGTSSGTVYVTRVCGMFSLVYREFEVEAR